MMRTVSSLLVVASLLVWTPVHALDLGGLVSKLEKLEGVQPVSAPVQTPAAPTLTAGAASALEGISNKDQVSSLKQALTQGAATAVASLARQDGFLGNDKVRIPLPENLQKVDNALRKFGMGKYADELVSAMNRAAETAVVEAKPLLIAAVSKMTVADAKDILLGGNDAATQYFRKNTETALSVKFKPVVSKSMKKVKLAEKYDQFAGKAARLGLIEETNASLDNYITRKAMDGLFVMMAEQEKSLREHPLDAVGSLAKKVFSLLRE